MTNSFPNFQPQGYQVIRELGHNYNGGRVTYLAIDLETNSPAIPELSQHGVTEPNLSNCAEQSRRVVIKHFQLSQSSSWSGYGAIEREIQVLQGLNHPGIPRYLDSFPTETGFCLVQEYKQAESLAQSRSFSPEEVKQIAIGLLEILVYLQQRLPFVSHRDIKPENILVDGDLEVFLVDFGIAKVGLGEATTGTVAKGTLGFMAPEQLFNREVTEASDLYGVGATLICLVTGTKSSEITNLIDDHYQLNFQHLVPQLSLRWLEWLERMVTLLPKYRYRNAAEALAALEPIYVTRTPEIVCSEEVLEFRAEKLGQKITQYLTIHNFVPETTLQGFLTIAPHHHDQDNDLDNHDPNYDPAYDLSLDQPQHLSKYLSQHSWIRLPYTELTGNRSMVKITVDTSKLMAAALYERELQITSNASPAVQKVKIRVKTAPIPVPTKKLPALSLFLLVSLGMIAAWLEAIAWGTIIQKHGSIGLAVALFITMIIALFGGMMAIAGNVLTDLIGKIRRQLKISYQQIDEILVFTLASGAAVSAAQFGSFFREEALSIAALAMVDAAVFMTMFITGKIIKINRQKGFNQIISLVVTLLCLGLGISFGLGTKLGWGNPWVLGSIAATTIPLAGIFLYPPLERKYRIDRYRQSESHLISP
jgi:serine/threonine protein kinase